MIPAPPPAAPTRTAVVVGNPRPDSRTLSLALRVAEELTGDRPEVVVDLARLGAALLDPADPDLADLVERLGEADLVVVASPVYKGTYTGLLKLFLDRFPGGTGLRGVAVPVMLGAAPHHALAAETTLRPVLTELGATVPGRALFLLDRDHDDPAALAPWVAATAPVVSRLLTREVAA